MIKLGVSQVRAHALSYIFIIFTIMKSIKYTGLWKIK